MEVELIVDAAEEGEGMCDVEICRMMNRVFLSLPGLRCELVSIAQPE